MMWILLLAALFAAAGGVYEVRTSRYRAPVGHSFGDYNVRVFNGRYADEVAGLFW